MLPAQEQRQAEAAGRGQDREGGRGRGRGATSLASQEAVSWQSSVRATCEMPIYSLANIASDRTTTARTPQWRLKLPLTSPSRLWLWLWIWLWLWVWLWFECQCNICRHDCQDTKAHGATRCGNSAWLWLWLWLCPGLATESCVKILSANNCTRLSCLWGDDHHWSCCCCSSNCCCCRSGLLWLEHMRVRLQTEGSQREIPFN